MVNHPLLKRLAIPKDGWPELQLCSRDFFSCFPLFVRDLCSLFSSHLICAFVSLFPCAGIQRAPVHELHSSYSHAEWCVNFFARRRGPVFLTLASPIRGWIVVIISRLLRCIKCRKANNDFMYIRCFSFYPVL